MYSGVNCHSVKNFFVSIMLPQRKNKRTGGPARNQQSRRQTCSGDSEVRGASTTTPPLKNRRVQPPLTRDDIPTIVEAVRALLPASTSEPTSTTNGAPATSRRINDPHYQVALLWQDKNPVPSHIASHAFTEDVSQQVIHTPTFLYWNTTHSMPMNKNDINKTDVPLYSCECLNILIHCHNILLDV